jgi:hypothetical protein
MSLINIYIQNTNTGLGMLKIEFTTDLVLNNVNSYFVCDTDNIQFGSESLTVNGNKRNITFDGVTDYRGFIRNGAQFNNGKNNIYVFNLNVDTINGSTLYGTGGCGSGWLGWDYFSHNAIGNFFIN